MVLAWFRFPLQRSAKFYQFAAAAGARRESSDKEHWGKFFDVEIKLPADLVNDKKKVAIRFQALGANEIAAVYGIRMIRADAEQ